VGGAPYPDGVSATRLLVLGVVRGYGRVHGYRVGADLLSWGAGEWANVKWGSIYHALRQATRAGLLREHDDVPGRTDYELTERGEAEFRRLLRDALRQPQPRPDLIGAALALLPALPRPEALALLKERLAALEERREKAQAQLDGWTDPPHVRELFGLWETGAAAGVEWTRGLIERLTDGAYAMAGEPGSPGRPGSWNVS
jgi:DNA-binding PadR family transcriptional regulator